MIDACIIPSYRLILGFVALCRFGPLSHNPEVTL